MILASAGSGKTYALTDRFVALLAHGAAPERIAALTFTRKAAGEFFDEILRKLAQAAAEETAAKKLAARIGLPALGCAEFLAMLRAVVEAMPRLSLGTLDSFFARVVRAFPLELGLGGDFEILQEHAARLERRRVLRRMFAHTGPEGAAQHDFIEAFKRATFGREEKRLGETLDRFLDEHAETFLAAPDPARWGRAEKIWPEGAPWFAHATARERDMAARALHAALAWDELNDRQRARLEDFFAELPAWSPGAELPDAVGYLLKNALEEWPALSEVRIERKKILLSRAAGDALRKLAGGIVGAELVRRLEMTRGVAAVLRGYEAVYDGAVRRGGRLTFADVQRLLQPVALTREAALDRRLFIDWRLDAQIDHWLLDEFQDTSFGQWSVLKNLIDEAVQDAGGARTFFCVGDVKQAIYTWREGDARLFREVLAHYNAAAPGTIEVTPLNDSWRSGPPIVAMVNRVFGDARALQTLFPADAAQRWSAEWGAHTSARPELGGFAQLRHADDEAGRFAETLRVIQEVQPLARGLSVAVLVQKNDTAAELADYLRREGKLPAIAESDLHVGTDNPPACALLALVRAAAHPGDRAAWAHVAMTPLARVLEAEKCFDADALTARLLGEIHARGFERTIEAWLQKLEPALAPDDRFSRERGRQLVEAARLFDETGSRDVAEFGQFIARHTVRESDAASVVRVMTVHKAKGLGFDLVILPDLEGKSIAARRRGLAVKKAADRSVEWVLDLPGEEFFARDVTLAAYAAAAEADACYEKLCLLYVAMTRAKRAMYVITHPIGNSSSKNFPRLLRDTLGEEWSEGDAQWFQRIPRATAPEKPVDSLPALAEPRGPRAVRRPAQTPSRPPPGLIEGAGLFSPAPDDAGAEFGRAVHALLAEVEWLAPGDADKFSTAWAGPGVDPAARAEALGCLGAEALAGVWRKIPGAEVWRERAFEIVLEGAWVTGVFDRVVVERGAQGRAVRATVFDFKTDRVGDGDDALIAAAARHAAQIGVYRRTVARLTGLDEAAVAGEVVWTRRRVAVPVTSRKF
jgi:ATP-dependent exoDNAse (exonuclease V) beta subunit